MKNEKQVVGVTDAGILLRLFLRYLDDVGASYSPLECQYDELVPAFLATVETEEQRG